MNISIRKFRFEDIPNKIEWINDSRNNRYLHYDLPLEYEKTCVWFEKNKDRQDRYDAVIEADGVPVGLIGLLSIDKSERKAEYYISMGCQACKGRGVAFAASELLLDHAFRELKLESLYLYTETGNLPAQKLFSRLGFIREGMEDTPLFYKGRSVDRYFYTMKKSSFLLSHGATPIQHLGKLQGNELYIKRDDLLPYSFGGNKARKGVLFFNEIDKWQHDCVVTYGSSHSNHCRIIANMAAERGMGCYIIAPEEVSDPTFNSRFMELFGAEITYVPVDDVHDTIEAKLLSLRSSGRNPFFIPGGGHGNTGTEAYVRCYDEIRAYEQQTGIHFDAVFLASGTGTTQAGLICGQLLNGDDRQIIGISIARKNPRGRSVVLDSVRDYMDAAGVSVPENELQEKTVFIDHYTGDGYGKDSDAVAGTIRDAMIRYGIPMDSTYTGKAFFGMRDQLSENSFSGRNILFIHTGGTPLFFDDLAKIQSRKQGLTAI